MIYVMSDLHGCYEEYIQMIEKIKLNDKDTLYVLGDVIDRGDDGIKILFDMMKRANVIPMLGNHEYMAYKVLKKLNVEITEENYDTHINSDVMEMYDSWRYNGGASTIRAFSKLGGEEKADIMDYLGEFELYRELVAGGRKYVLVHGGLANFSPEKDLSEYSIYDIVWGRCDYARKYFDDKFLVTGHTPTFYIDEHCRGKIYRQNNHIAIDCGLVYGANLGCICLDTMEEFYVK